MKCENCENELTGGAIVCRVCNHNNARRAVSQWRARKTGELQEPSPRQVAPIDDRPKINARKDADDNLLRFPASLQPAASRPTVARHAASGVPRFSTPRASRQIAAEPAVAPAWRDEVKERVRLAREKRQQSSPETGGDANEAQADPNPLVESALKRIRRSSPQPATVPAIAPRIARKPAQAAALADPFEEIQLERPRPPIAPRAEERFFSKPEPQPAIKRAPAPPTRVNPDSRTLTPKTPAPSPAAQPESNPLAVGDSILLVPRAKSQPLTLPKIETPRPARVTREYTPEDQREVSTEIIEIAAPSTSPLPLPEARPATLWLRTLAGACDFEIIAAAYLPLFGAYATLNTSLGGESLFVMGVLMAAIAFVYQLVMLLISDRTFGMAMLGLRLVNTDNDEMPVTRRQKMLRAWAASIAFCCPPLNLLFTRLNPARRSLPDVVSGSTIVGK